MDTLAGEGFEPDRGGRASPSIRPSTKRSAGGGDGDLVVGQGAAPRLHAARPACSEPRLVTVATIGTRGRGKLTHVRKEWLETDYYAVLGVSKDASDEGHQEGLPQARPAVPPRHQSRATRPPKRKFKEVNEAYDVLGRRRDPQGVRPRPRDGLLRRRPRRRTSSTCESRTSSGAGGVRGAHRSTSSAASATSSAGQAAQPDPKPATTSPPRCTLSFHEAISGVTQAADRRTASGVKVKIPQGVADGARIRVAGKGAPG